ncbi:MAG: Phosphopantetheine adenylyltransferase [Candidatus Bathyarchaeota archaeon BA2]|nr:MAG: Phosphopantetheine adenylyltransferase [Candidatus Bathyarchaeota archaeon BA2]
MKKLENVAVGGTFDEFHRGHQALLKMAFEAGNHVFIGLCSDDFVKKLGKPHKIAPYEERLEELKSFLRRQGVLDRAEILPLHDPYGVTVSSNRLDGLVMSRETEARAYEINEKRRAKGLKPLKIIVIEMVLAENGVSISTTRIQRKEINRDGRLLKT